MDSSSDKLISKNETANTGANKDIFYHHGNTYEGQYFQNARNVSVSGSTFKNVQKIYLDSSFSDIGFDALCRQVSHDATFDAAERSSAGRCHPGTRKAIIKEIIEWVSAPGSDILWMHGPVGIGKSSIAQTIADILCDEYRNIYGGSFFFAAGVSGRDNGKLLFPSLAYQIGINLPEMKALIGAAMNKDHSLPTKTMEVQLRSLLVEPLLLASDAIKAHTPAVVIDGLDECQGREVQCKILSLIACALRSSGVPLRFIIASRPESWIREAFGIEPLLAITKAISPRDSGDSDRDIEKYLRDSFEDIVKRKRKFMGQFALPWPSNEVIERLVQQASGQFIYASTVVKFVDARNRNPTKQMDVLLTFGPSRNAAFTSLDSLYRNIFSVYHDQKVLETVLAGIMLKLPPRAIQIMLDVDYSDALFVLDCLGSVVEVVEPENYVVDDEELDSVFGPPHSDVRVHFYHWSIEEFVKNNDRSGYSIDLEFYEKKIFSHHFDIVIDCLQRGVYAHKNHLGDIQPNLYHTLQRNHIRNLYSSLAEDVPMVHKLITALERFLYMELPPPDQLGTVLQYTVYFDGVLKHPRITTGITNVQTKIVEGLISSRTFQITPVSILLSAYFALEEISDILDLPISTVKKTLIQLEGAGLIESSINKNTPLEQYHRHYRLRFNTMSFPSNPNEYRLQQIVVVQKLCSRLLFLQDRAFLLRGFLLLKQKYALLVEKFFNNPSLSDIRDKHDWENPQFKLLVEIQCDPRWEQAINDLRVEAAKGPEAYPAFDFTFDVILIWSLRQINAGILQSINGGLSAKLLNPFIFASYRFLASRRDSDQINSQLEAVKRASLEGSPVDQRLHDFLSNFDTLEPKDGVYITREGSLTNEGCCLITWTLSVLLLDLETSMISMLLSTLELTRGFDWVPEKEILAISILHFQWIYVTEIILQPTRNIYSLSIEKACKLYLPYGFRSKMSDYLKKYPIHILPEKERETLNVWLFTRVFEADKAKPDIRLEAEQTGGDKEEEEDTRLYESNYETPGRRSTFSRSGLYEHRFEGLYAIDEPLEELSYSGSGKTPMFYVPPDHIPFELIDESVRNYVNNIVKILYPFGDKNVLSSMIANAIENHPDSQEAVKLLSKAYYGRQKDPYLPVLADYEVKNTIISLRTSLNTRKHRQRFTADDAMTALHVVSLYLFDGGGGDWDVFLELAVMYVEIVLDNPMHFKNYPVALEAANEKDEFVIKTTIWFDVLASITTQKEPRLLKYIRELFKPDLSWVGRPPGYSMMSPMGCQNTVVWALAETSTLSYWKRRRMEEGSLSNSELVHRVAEIDKYLEEGPLRERPQTNEEEWTRYLASEIFRTATRLFLKTVVSGDLPQVPDIEEAVSRTFRAIAKLLSNFAGIQQSAIVRSTVFGIFICGALTDNDVERRVLTINLEQNTEVGNCKAMAELLKGLWENRPHPSQPVRWRNTLKDTKFLLV